MSERQITFIDVDENPLIVLMMRDRVQIAGADSKPELEGGELRAFATALFAAYVGPQLQRRLATGRGRVTEVRDQLVARGEHALVEALDGALRALVDVHDAMTTALEAVPPIVRSPDPAEQPINRKYTPVGRRRRLTKGARVRGGTPTGWGWRPLPAVDPADPFPPFRW